MESRSPGQKTISSYLAKYLSKSFHLRTLYTQHGLTDNHKTYRFFKNLYQYETRPVLLITKHKLDAATGQHLPKNQKIFRKFNYESQITTYFYRTNETLIGQASNPILIKKNYRLGTRSLNPLNLLSLATKHSKKEVYQFKKPQQQKAQSRIQELEQDLTLKNFSDPTPETNASYLKYAFYCLLTVALISLLNTSRTRNYE